jgi:hypothetical protein
VYYVFLAQEDPNDYSDLHEPLLWSVQKMELISSAIEPLMRLPWRKPRIKTERPRMTRRRSEKEDQSVYV